MKIKPKNAGSAILIVAVVIVLIVVTRYIGIGTTRNATRAGYVDKGGWHDWSASYTLLDGTLQHTLRPRSSDNLLHINVKNESGTLSIEVKNAGGDVVFQEENLDTGEYDMYVSEKVTVIVRAKGHKGSFSFNFESSE